MLLIASILQTQSPIALLKTLVDLLAQMDFLRLHRHHTEAVSRQSASVNFPIQLVMVSAVSSLKVALPTPGSAGRLPHLALAEYLVPAAADPHPPVN